MQLGSDGPAVRGMEIAFGHFDEDDIERLEDEYGRLTTRDGPAVRGERATGPLP